MREIGGYMGMEQSLGSEYYDKLIKLNSARHCLWYLIETKKISKIFIPYFLCASIRCIIEQSGADYEFYHINDNFEINFDKKLKKDEFIFIVNYYGQMNNEKLKFYYEKYKNIIVDNTQAFFQRPIEDTDTIYSCRKFFGVPDGGYLATNSVGKQYETDISYTKMEYILGRYEKSASEFYQLYKENESKFPQEPIKQMSVLTRNLLCFVDYDTFKKKRNENFLYLHKHLKKFNNLELIMPEGAFMYPFYCKNGADIRKYLIQHKIYVPMLWMETIRLSEKKWIEYDYAENILPLPCDQRYGREEMQSIINTIYEVI